MKIDNDRNIKLEAFKKLQILQVEVLFADEILKVIPYLASKFDE